MKKMLTLLITMTLIPISVLFAQTGNAVVLSGDQHIGVLTPLPSIEDQTMEVWLNKTVGEETEVISYLGNSGSTGWGLILFQNELCFLAGGIIVKPSGKYLQLNQWVHIAGTVSLISENTYTAKLFYNGMLADSFAVNINPISETDSLFIGTAAGSEPFFGSLDEFRLWPTARSVDQIRSTLYQTAISGEPSILFHFDEENGATVIPDFSGNSHNGLLSGTSIFSPSSVFILPVPVLNSAIPDSGLVTLNWTSSDDVKVTRYYIYEEFAGNDLDGGGDYGLVGFPLHKTNAILPIDSVLAPVTTYTRTGLTNGDHYDYQIVAATGLGLNSDPSNSLRGAARNRKDKTGYSWKFSAENDGPVYFWTDISETGNLIEFSGYEDDASFGKFPIGFKFPFYNAAFDSFYVSSNGILTFDHANTQYGNYPFPSEFSDSNTIAMYWNDMEWDNGTTAYYKNDGSRLIIQINKTRILGQGSGGEGGGFLTAPGKEITRHLEKSSTVDPYITYQFILYPNGDFEWQFHDVTLDQNNATLGFQNKTKTDGLTLFHDQNLIHNQMAIYVTCPKLVSPVLVKAVPNTGSVTLTWTQPDDNRVSKYYIYSVLTGSDVDGGGGGELRAKTTAGVFPVDSVLSATTLTKTISSLPDGDQFDFTIVAANEYGFFSDPSNALRGTARPRTNDDGYSWTYSDDEGGPSLPWTDISETGTPIEFEPSADDSYFGRFPIGFQFPFYTGVFDSFYVSTNGVLYFSEPGTSYSNSFLPSNALSDKNMIAMYWNDMVWNNNTTSFYQVDEDKMILQVNSQVRYQDWNEGGLVSDPGNGSVNGLAKTNKIRGLHKTLTIATPTISYQLILYPNGNFDWVFGTSDIEQNDATIGFQNEDGTKGLTIFNNQNLVKPGMTLHVENTIYTVPVELSSFTVTPSGNTITLNWETTSETNNAGFEIQKSALRPHSVTETWETIGFVNGKGTTTEKQSYSFVDPSPVTRNLSPALYRLKQVDTDGKVTYSKTLSYTPVPLDFEVFANYPNPFNPATTIKFSLPKTSTVSVKMFNILGQEVLTVFNGKMDAGIKLLPVDASGFASGVYFYSVSANGKTITKSMTLLK